MSPFDTPLTTVFTTVSAPGSVQSPEFRFDVTTAPTRSIAAAQFSAVNSFDDGLNSAVSPPPACLMASNPWLSWLRRSSPVSVVVSTAVAPAEPIW